MEEDLVRLAKSQLAFRRLRYTHFDHALFDEHAWDMLMILFVARCEGREIEDIELITETAARLPTGLRWLSMLEHDKRVARTVSGERILVTLTDEAATSMLQFFQDAAAAR
jgi:hypothetical protein